MQIFLLFHLTYNCVSFLLQFTAGIKAFNLQGATNVICGLDTILQEILSGNIINTLCLREK